MEYKFQVTPGPWLPGPWPPPPSAPEPLLAAWPGTAVPLSDRDCLYSPQGASSAAPTVLGFLEWQALQACLNFQPRAAHAGELCRLGLAPTTAHALALLQGLADAGLLVAADDWLAAMRTPLAPRPLAPIDAIYIRACDRPAALAALLDSLAQHQRRHGTRHPVVVIDDSRDPAAAAAIQALARAADPATGSVRIVDAAAGARYVRQVAVAAGIDPADAARFLVRPVGTGRFGGGRGLNLALLLSAGRRLLLLDDDMRFPLRASPAAVDGLDIDAAANAETCFYDDLPTALAAGAEPSGDPLERHWRACGARVSDWLRETGLAPTPAQLRGLPIEAFTPLAADARIVATLNGTRGASGADNTVWMYRLPPAQRQALVASEAAYRRNLDGESIGFAYRQTHLAERVWFSACALDNASLLPCTAAGGRGEDALLHALIAVVDPAAVSLNLPLTIGHAPVEARLRSANNRRPLRPSLNRYLSDWVHEQRAAIRSAAPADRVGQLAQRLRDVASAAPARQYEHLRDYVLTARAELVERLERVRAETTGLPGWWQADVAELLAINRAALRADAVALADWPELDRPDEVAAAMDAELAQLADALDVWPRLWTAAATGAVDKALE